MEDFKIPVTPKTLLGGNGCGTRIHKDEATTGLDG